MSKKSILIVEENIEFIQKLKSVPNIFGHSLHIETSFASALDYLTQNPCIAVIQEIVIAKQVNMDLIKLVKTNQEHQNFEIPIAVMNDSMSPEYAQSMKQKLSGVIHKPFEVDTFVQIVKLIIAIDYLRKLITRLKALQEKEDVTKIAGVTEHLKEAIQLIKGFLEEDTSFDAINCKDSIDEFLTEVLGNSEISRESAQLIKGLEQESEDVFNVLGQNEIEPLSTYDIKGTLDLDESAITVKASDEDEEVSSQKITGTTDHIQEESIKISGKGEGNIDDGITIVKGENQQKAEEIMEEEQNLKGEEKWVYQQRSEIEKLKADILDRQNQFGQTYCMLAAEAGDLAEVERIVEEGANLTLRSKDGFGMIHYACRSGNIDIVNFFLEKGVDFKSKDNKGNIPVVYAIRKQSLEIVKVLADKFHNLRHSNENGQTLAMEAAFAGNEEVLKYLVNRGAPVDGKDNKHRSSFWYAKKKKHVKIMEFLKSKGVSS